MKQCIKCHEWIEDSATFCIYCTAKQPGGTPTELPPEKKTTRKEGNEKSKKSPARKEKAEPNLPIKEPGKKMRAPVAVEDHPSIEGSQALIQRQKEAEKEQKKLERARKEQQQKKETTAEPIPGNPLPPPQESPKRVENGRYNDNYDGYYDDTKVQEEKMEKEIAMDMIIKAAKIIAAGILIIVVVEVLVTLL